MTSAPTVSIVLPVYNREKLICRAIDSVLAQTMSDFELLIIDDCSTDSTMEVIEQHYSDSRIKLHSNQTNLGPAGARNKGIELACGKYVAFQDSDDRWFPEKLSRQMDAIENTPGVKACYCGALYYAAEQCYYIPSETAFKGNYADNGDLSEVVLYSNPVTPQALLVERSLFDAVGGFDPTLRISEDWELAIRMAQKARFAFVAEPLAVIYRTANSVSSDLVANIEVRKRLLSDYSDLFLEHPAARAWQNYIIGGQSIKNRDFSGALRFFRQSYRDDPSFRCFLQIQRARLFALFS